MYRLGFQTRGDLQRASLGELMSQFGRFGSRLYQLVRGIDDRPVKTQRQRKSLSVEATFASNLPGLAECQEQLPTCSRS